MTEAGAKPRRRRVWRYLLFALLAGSLVLAGLAWYATTDSFQAMVRRRLVAELEKVTGGRAELGSFHTTPFRLRVEVRDLTIHGREAAGEVPYAHAERVVAEIKIISILGAEFGFHSLILDHPVVHVIVYPDGTTNQPAPKVRASGKNPMEQLFNFSVSRLEVRRGEVLWNDEKIPVDFVVNDVSADMQYSLLHRRYISNMLLGKIVTKWQDYRPFAWMLEAHFNLGEDGVEVNSLIANSGRSRVQAKGHLKNFRDPQIDGTYDAKLDLQEAAAIFRRPEMRRGILEAQGSGSWLLQHLISQGKISLKDFDWHDRSLDLSNVSAEAGFSATPQKLALSKLQGHLLGGSVSGDVDATGWLDEVQGVKAGKPRAAGKGNGEEGKGSVHLRLNNISAGALADALSTPAYPFKKMNVAGSGNGTVEARWARSLGNLEAELAIDVTAPSSAAPNQLPVKAKLRATYRRESGEVEVAQFDASTPGSEVHASGRLAATGALKLSIATSNLNEWEPILAGLGNPQHIPGALHGQASFNGAATGKLPFPSFAGNVQVTAFDYRMPATARTPEQTFHWDFARADVQLSTHSFSVHDGLLQHGDAVLSFNVSTTLDHGHYTDQSVINARVNIRNANAAEVMALAGYNYPLQGRLNSSIDLSGTWSQLQGTGQVQLADATFYGEPVRSFDTVVHFSGGEVQLENMIVVYYDSRASGKATYNLSTRAFRFDLSGSNFDLVHIPQSWATRLKIEGRADFTAQGSGTPEEPAINASLHFRDLIFDHERMGEFVVEAVTHGPELHVSGHSQFQAGELAIEGNVHLRQDWPSTADLRFAHLDVDSPLRSYLSGRLTGHSVASGTLHVEGPLRRPADLSLTGELSDFSLGVENIKLHSQGPLSFTVSGRQFQLKSLRLVGEETDLSASGTVELTGDEALDLHAQGQANLKLIESFDSAITSSGVVTVDMTVSGTVPRPVTQGRVEVQHGGIAHLDLPSAFSDINGTLLFNQNRLQVENLTAHTGGGLVTFGGFATWYNRQLSLDVTLKEEEVRLRYPPGVSSTANAELHLVGNSSASTLSGDVTVTKLSVTPGFDFGAYLARSARSPVLPPTNPLLNRIRLDVHIVTTPELQMQTAVVRLSGEADLRLRGTAAKPVLFGRADILEGEVYFNGTKYELERGEVAFTSPVNTTPVLDLQATTHVRDYDITLRLNGEPDKLRVTYRSEPPLPEADIITLLAIGRTTTEESAQTQSGQSSFTQEASSAILNQALNATVSNRAQSLFGVSRIKIDPAGLNTETTIGRGPLVTIEQQVSNNFTITYSTSVEQAAQQIIQVEYNLTHNVSIVAVRDQNGVVSFDVRVRHRKK